MNGPRRVKVEGDLFHPRFPDGAVYVGRAAPYLRQSKFANPHKVGICRVCGTIHDRPQAIELYRRHLRKHPDLIEAARRELPGRDLACRCKLQEPCHADLLLALAQTAPVDPRSMAWGDDLMDEEAWLDESI